MRALVLAVRFALELCLLAALAAGGWELAGGGVTGVVLGAAAALAAATAWGAWIGPRSERRLRDPGRLALEVVLFVAGGAGVWAAWSITAAVVFTGASTSVAVLTRIVGEPPAPRK